jgi:hypothetical protein
MDENEWEALSEPGHLLFYLWIRHASERKLRLFAVACCGRVWAFLDDPRSRRAVDVAERFADGLEDITALSHAWGEAQDALEQRLDGRVENAQVAVTFAISHQDH